MNSHKTNGAVADDSALRSGQRRVSSLFREATVTEVAHSIRVLALCSLFESLLRAVYRHTIAPLVAADTQAFELVRDRVCAELRERSAADRGAGADAVHHQRLAALLANAEPINIRAVFLAVVGHLNLNPEHWDAVYAVWTKNRNPASHRITGRERTEAAYEDQFAQIRPASREVHQLATGREAENG